MGVRGLLLSFGRASGAWRPAAGVFGRHRVTVLGYHRIADPGSPGFRGFAGNASATPDEFASQIAWIASRMTPITAADLLAAAGGAALPPRPVLVTFDDGYRDNLTVAAPILAEHGILPVIFLATDHIGVDTPFWWDRAAAVFAAAGPGEADLPLLGPVAWDDPAVAARRWITAAKEVPDPVMRRALADLVARLDGAAVAGPEHLSWEEVALLADRGVTFGAHTRRHAILPALADDDARAEITGSVQAVAAAIGAPPTAFAYPNGRAVDVDDRIVAFARDAGIAMAFTLVPGPARVSEVRRDPMRIRRVYVHHGDALDRFVAKVAGVPRLVPILR